MWENILLSDYQTTTHSMHCTHTHTHKEKKKKSRKFHFVSSYLVPQNLKDFADDGTMNAVTKSGFSLVSLKMTQRKSLGFKMAWRRKALQNHIDIKQTQSFFYAHFLDKCQVSYKITLKYQKETDYCLNSQALANDIFGLFDWHISYSLFLFFSTSKEKIILFCQVSQRMTLSITNSGCSLYTCESGKQECLNFF